jgi:DNA-binding LytR/AlgR family response regulator
MIKCFVVDDEAHAIEVLSRYIQQTPGLELAGASENPLTALDDITTGRVRPDIAFLDVDMPQLSGLDLAGLISAHTRVVFTTAFRDYALPAYDKNAVDFLLKPISYERFLRSVTKVRERLAAAASAGKAKEEETYFFVKGEAKGSLIRVDFDDIAYIEAQKNYVVIHLSGHALTTYLTMKEIEVNLPAGTFCRVHKSFLVHLAKVSATEGNEITLKDKRIIPLGPSYRDSFLETVSAKLVKSKRGL